MSREIQNERWNFKSLNKSEDLRNFVGDTREYKDFRLEEKGKKLVIYPNKVAEATKENLLNLIKQNSTRAISPVSNFYMLDGRHYGDLIASNYWYISKKRYGTDTVLTERIVYDSFEIDGSDKVVSLSGKIDILDENEKIIWEIKCYASGYTQAKLDKFFQQAMMYKNALVKEDISKKDIEGYRFKNYEDYKVRILVFNTNWKREGRNNLFDYYELENKKAEDYYTYSIYEKIAYVKDFFKNHYLEETEIGDKKLDIWKPLDYTIYNPKEVEIKAKEFFGI